MVGFQDRVARLEQNKTKLKHTVRSDEEKEEEEATHTDRYARQWQGHRIQQWKTLVI